MEFPLVCLATATAQWLWIQPSCLHGSLSLPDLLFLSGDRRQGRRGLLYIAAGDDVAFFDSGHMSVFRDPAWDIAPQVQCDVRLGSVLSSDGSEKPSRPRCTGHRGRGVQATAAEISDAPPFPPRSMAVYDHNSHQHSTVTPLVGRLGGPKPPRPGARTPGLLSLQI